MSKQLYYISPSILPSLSANSVHVINQIIGLSEIGFDVILFAARAVSQEQLVDSIHKQYGVELKSVRIISVPSRNGRAVNLRIVIRFLMELVRMEPSSKIVSRNLYASFLLAILGRKLIYEIHDIETGLRAWLQKTIIKKSNIQIITISNKLTEYLSLAHNIPIENSIVLHDAAPANLTPLTRQEKDAVLRQWLPELMNQQNAIAGYFGHLYPGRGIEIIESIAMKRPNILFLIAGGRDEDVKQRRNKNKLQNLLYLGHMPHNDALRLSSAVDILLMPYQLSVSVGVCGRDTAKWMSPMKMFEYMASGVPLISSDLPVLREVLRHEENALLVCPDDIDAWVTAVDKLIDDTDFASRIANSAYMQYQNHHTWEQRAHALTSCV